MKTALPILAAIVLLLPLSTASGDVINLHPSQDTSIYSESDNSNALGGLFAGQTAGGNLRRALVQFNIAGSIPAGATITSASFSITQIKIGPGGAADFQLLPVLAAWGEGTSAGSGSGSAATPGDATWNFRSYNADSWATAGADFGPVTATTTFTTLNSTYTFASDPNMVATVQSWLQSPASNFGWILRAADESAAVTTAREFGSRESLVILRPTLTVSFTPAPVPEPSSLMLLVAGTLFLVRRRRS